MAGLHDLRLTLRQAHNADETQALRGLMAGFAPDGAARARATNHAADLVRAIRNDSRPGLMEVFLAEYGLSTNEGVALMCLAEALLRVPDAETIDALIEDKIAPSAWGQHLGQSSSSLVNASTWALMLTGKVLSEGTGVAAILKGAVKRLGEPVIRAAVGRAIKEMGAQFVLGETIEQAVARGADQAQAGYCFSYDMLGEAALTAQDAQGFYDAYRDAITRLAADCRSQDIRDNPGISIKLSALFPRYELGQKDQVMDLLVPRVLALAHLAKSANMGLNIDAEEAERLDLSLDVIAAVLGDPGLAGWDGFGIVVQAYSKRAPHVLDWLYRLAGDLGRKIMVRLVKGAYWDSEIKRAQVEGLAGFPVYTRKSATDISYICCAEKLLGMGDRIYGQFATHNAHTVAMILEMAGQGSVGAGQHRFEFQRLHGMGESLHDLVLRQNGTRCRIYAPVGAHRDLLAYLVRRLLENGANSSFVNQIVDGAVAPEIIAADPFETWAAALADSGAENGPESGAVRAPADLYGAARPNSQGWDLHNTQDLAAIDQARTPFCSHIWAVGPMIAGGHSGDAGAAGAAHPVRNPADPSDLVGHVTQATPEDVAAALSHGAAWAADPQTRAAVLFRAAALYEAHFGQFFAVLTREAGKTPMDAIAELREAVDFLRYYAGRGAALRQPARGVVACISPWNFPLAIFTGQIAAALAAGNGVVAKPAEPTAITAALATELLHQAGVPVTALQLLPGQGAEVGARLTSDPRIQAVCFTGSTQTAQTINRAMAAQIAPDAPLIAETGGLNAMIVDSTALPEQAIQDILASAFQSAGQRCSALRMLYLQEDVADAVLEMLFGAMDAQVLGNPWEFATDIGPVITQAAADDILAYIDQARQQGRLLHQLTVPEGGTFVAPTVLQVAGIADLRREIFGPVLHVARFRAADLDAVVAAINATGYGLTFGMHSRIDDRIDQVIGALNVGNIYINRNQIGAVVGSQPFGGEGLSGTGPKAGGPSYVERFVRAAPGEYAQEEDVEAEVAPESGLDHGLVQAAIAATPRPPRLILKEQQLPGPTGESNRLLTYGRGVILCLGPTAQAARAQAAIALAHGCRPVAVAPGLDAPGLDTAGLNAENALPEDPQTESTRAGGVSAVQMVDGRLDPAVLAMPGALTGFDAVVSWADLPELRALRVALAQRAGALIPLITEADFGPRCFLDRHVCIDTTAAGGNAALLAQAG